MPRYSWFPISQVLPSCTSGRPTTLLLLSVFSLVSAASSQRLSSRDTNSVVGVLMDFLNGDGAMDVILFVRSIVEQYEVHIYIPDLFASVTPFHENELQYLYFV